MRIGASLVLIAIGAILRFAVTQQQSHGVDWGTVGVILMIVGAVGALITIVLMTARRRTDVVYRGSAQSAYATPVTDPRTGSAYPTQVVPDAQYGSATYVEPAPLDPRL